MATGRQWGQLKIEKSCHGIMTKWVKCDKPTLRLCLLQLVYEQKEQPVRALCTQANQKTQELFMY